MARINFIEMDMSISRNVYEGKSNYFLIALIQKVATYTVVPLALIALFEGVVKNLIGINLLNFGIVVLNRIHDVFTIPEKKETREEPPIPAPLIENRPDPLNVPFSPIPKKKKETLFVGVSTAAKIGVCVIVAYIVGASLYSLYASGGAAILAKTVALPMCPNTLPNRLLAWVQ